MPGPQSDHELQAYGPPGAHAMLAIKLFSASSFCVVAFGAGVGAGAAEQDVAIESADGFILAARYYAARASGPVILLLHQCDRDNPQTGY